MFGMFEDDDDFPDFPFGGIWRNSLEGKPFLLEILLMEEEIPRPTTWDVG